MTVFRNDRIQLTTAQMRALARHGGTLFANIGCVIRMGEPGYPTRLYLPRADSRIDCLWRSPTRVHCPFKGDMWLDAVWSCKASYPAMAAISTYLSFEHPQLTRHFEEHRTGR